MLGQSNTPPDLERVLNTFRTEAEMDRAVAEQSGGAKRKYEEGEKLIGAVKFKKPWKGKQRQKKDNSKKETRECNYCHKVGRLWANCRKRLAELDNRKRKRQEDASDSSDEDKQPKKKSKKAKQIGFAGRWTKSAGSIKMMRAPESEDKSKSNTQIMAYTAGRSSQAWMLDTGTAVHVCTSEAAFGYGMREAVNFFDDWRGESNSSDGIGLVKIRVQSDMDPDGPGVVLDLKETHVCN